MNQVRLTVAGMTVAEFESLEQMLLVLCRLVVKPGCPIELRVTSSREVRSFWEFVEEKGDCDA